MRLLYNRSGRGESECVERNGFGVWGGWLTWIVANIKESRAMGANWQLEGAPFGSVGWQ